MAGSGGGVTPPRACGATLPLQGRVKRALPQRKDRIDEVVPRPLFAELDLQAIGEKAE